MGIFHKNFSKKKAEYTKQMMYFLEMAPKYIIVQWIWEQRAVTVDT